MSRASSSALTEHTRQSEGAVTSGFARAIRWVAASTVVSVVLYAVWLLALEREAVVDVIATIDASLWSILLALSLLNYLLRMARWQYCTRVLGGNVPPLRNALIYVAGFAFTTTPGKAGEALRTLYLMDAGVPPSTSLSMLGVERLLDLFCIAALAALIAGQTRFGYGPCVLVLLACVLAVAWLRSAAARRLLERWEPANQASVAHRLWHAVYTLNLHAAQLLQVRVFGVCLLIGLIAWTAEGVGLFLLIEQTGHALADTTSVALLMGLGIYGMALLAGAVSLLPGGVGSTEAAMVALLAGCGVDLASATVVTLACRVATLWFAVALGFLALAFVRLPRAATVTS